ncbi:hypothetical protein L486_00623 [Kwoniella mangroviensis CBS 10435]|uniref:Uncharacterized protein n=1 Tax=Kwoniella mangroviensis CBS 10435 TaxID=1331196 RepID=A0A1B9IZL5_9TREE|nr:uncharacterized protein I203_04154 [Kwoniella mangroviensis CBS 8507]OCF60979.1 hypothetical protein L486_00623 [Kwoniella mangroviensis CBS 10435]OCF66578.1 hypothetical protein I203_04154 [Kwoniella mangroviensis CBS 8507]OCF74273.1 hypothetical protein I204_04643 [Kwoniella mangroviensis CBS 8886]
MTRRSPPSKLTFLPSHIPTPPRGAPKYFLPTLPPSLPTVTRPSLSVPLPLPQPHHQALDPEFMEHPYRGYKVAEEGTKPPWVRSRGIDLAEKELGRGLERPRGVVLGR